MKLRIYPATILLLRIPYNLPKDSPPQKLRNSETQKLPNSPTHQKITIFINSTSIELQDEQRRFFLETLPGNFAGKIEYFTENRDSVNQKRKRTKNWPDGYPRMHESNWCFHTYSGVGLLFDLFINPGIIPLK